MSAAVHPSTALRISTNLTEQTPRMSFQPTIFVVFDSIFWCLNPLFSIKSSPFFAKWGVGGTRRIPV
jgi:hypothetical protein